MKKKNEEVTFGDILGIFIPKIWIIVLVAVLCASMLAFYSTAIVDDSYTTYSTLSHMFQYPHVSFACASASSRLQ